MHTLLLALTLQAHAGRPPGEIVAPAVIVDITPEGLDQLDVLAGALVPESIPIDDIEDGDEADEICIDLLFTEICFTPWRWGYEVSGFDVGLRIAQLDLVPGTGQIELAGAIEVNLASASDPGTLGFLAQLLDFGDPLIDIDESCDVWLEPTEIGFTTTIDLVVVPNGPDGTVVVVDVAPVDLSIDITGLRIEGCAIDFLDDFLNAVTGFLGSAFNLDLGELLTGLVEPLIDQFMGDALATIEDTLTELLSSLTIDQELDLLGVILQLHLEPGELTVDPAGIRFALDGSFAGTGNPAPCVSGFGIDESLATGGAYPGIGDGPLDPPHHLGAMIDDDFLNQALFAVWYEGLLCFEIGAGGGALPIDLPIPLDTSLLRILAGDTFAEFFPETKPIALATRPRKPPVAAAVPGGVSIALEELGLDLYAELDDRMVRLAGIDIGATIPAGLDFDGATGDLGIDLGLGPDAFTFGVVYNELKPEGSQQLGDGLSKLVGNLVGSLIGPLLGDLAFALPSFSGLGLSEAVIGPSGPDGDFIGFFAKLGLVDYGEGGDLGAIGDCAGGCSTGGSVAPWLLGLVVFARRRRDDDPRGED
ncbi:MAG: hypothetical protein H6732_07930 [Alphaproteobacteria bacterium]|nr:hypothetical protein [Alphaproteobacteria bacterium]